MIEGAAPATLPQPEPQQERPAFIVNNLNKGKYVYRACAAALAQTWPCEILLTDGGSSDNSWEEIKRAVAEAPHGADHTVTAIQSQAKGISTHASCNEHIAWAVAQTKGDWIFQSSSDDYSLPTRVSAAMNRLALLKMQGHEPSGIGVGMWFDDETLKLQPGERAHTGYPTEDGFVDAADGMMKMAYGSTIWAYRREFLEKVGLAVPCTLDVYLGYLCSQDKGYYVIKEPHHVHHAAIDAENLGFQGKMRAAEASGDQAQINRINELNRFQLFQLYYYIAKRSQELYPMQHQNHRVAISNMLIQQACGWMAEREKLHAAKTTPGII